jgi:aspartate racemase
MNRVIGIVGGMGPHAHIELERRLLAAVPHAGSDQEYPEWVVSSMPQTPDRTLALLSDGESPVPCLVRSLERLAACADFAVIACLTAHAFLDEIRSRTGFPILDLVEVTLKEAVRRFGSGARIGVLATSGALHGGALHGGIYRRTADRVAPGIGLVSLLDLPGGDGLQEELVNRPIYGPLHGSRRSAGGIKSGSDRDPEAGILHRETLGRAVRRLAAEGAVCVIAGCTELPLALGRDPVDGIPLLDPLDLAALTAVRIARGELPLP